MNSVELDAAIAEANRIFGPRASGGTQAGAGPSEAGWPAASRSAERRFEQTHAKLFPFLGRKVRTPGGPGTLLQVLADRVTVVLDTDRAACSLFLPAEIEPVSWEP